MVFGGMQAFPMMFGNCYVLSVNPGYAMLYRCSFDDDGNPTAERVQSNTMNIRLPEAAESVFELRLDRNNAAIYLYVDGESVCQWDESTSGYVAKGNGFGFQLQGPGNRVRITDILTAEWCGMPDSARSLDAPDRDVLLLANGTDRFSGTVSTIRNDDAKITGPFAEMTVPLGKIAEIRFAKNRRATSQEAPGGCLAVHLPPLGRVSGKPLGCTADSLQLESPALGRVTVALDYANVLDFQQGHSFLDDWDAEF